MITPEWKQELSGVPDLACVAFAARCARRVQPLFLVAWPEAPQRLYHLLEGALETVEESTGGVERTNSTFAFNGMSAVKAAHKAGAHQASAVASTIACATSALAAVGYGDLSISHAAQAADYVVKVFKLGRGDGRQDALRSATEAMQKDVARLREGMELGKIDFGMPVPADFLGPLWPDGEPDYVFQLPSMGF